MKKTFLTTILCASFALGIWAQAPQKFNYQAVARDNAGAVIKNQSIGLRITIEDDNGTALYTETHQVVTNDYGLFTLAIGTGTPVAGGFTAINWGGGERYVKVDVDATGGTNYTTASTSQLMSVPYALYAENSGNGGDSDPTNELQELTFNAVTGELTLSNGNTITLPMTTGGDNWGSQTVNTDATLTGNGTSSSPLSVNGVLTDNQTLSVSGTNLTIAGGNTVSLSGINTDAQALSLTGTTLAISGGNSVNLSGIDTDDQTLSLTGTNLAIAGGNTVNLSGINTDGQTLSLSGSDLTISGGNTVTLPLGSGGDNWGTQVVQHNSTLTGNGTASSPLAVNGILTDNQTLSLSGSTLSISSGNNVNLSAIDTDDQTLSLSGSTLSIAGGNSVNLSSINTDAQSLSLSGNTLSISGGNSITLPSGGTGLPAGTLGATFRHNGSTWLADSSIFSNGTFVGIGTSQTIGSARFIVSSPNTSSYGGMYINTAGAGAYPFYGYATAGVFRGWTYYHGGTNAWHYNDGNGDRITVKGTNFGINNIDPTKRLDVVGTLRFNTGTSATGKALVGTAADGSAEWGTVGDAGIEDMQRHFWIPASQFSEDPVEPDVVRELNFLAYYGAGLSDDVFAYVPVPNDYAGGNVFVEIFFVNISTSAGTAGFAVALDGIADNANLFGPASTITPPLVSVAAGGINNITIHKQSFIYTGLTTTDEFFLVRNLFRNVSGTLSQPIYLMGMKVTYDAKR